MITENIAQHGATPLGLEANGKVFSISAEDRAGILYVFGRTGQGKSVMLETLILSDIRNGRGGIFIDPYGDLIQELQSYIPGQMKQNIVTFEAHKGTVDENLTRFQQEVNLMQIHSDAEKFLLCTLSYEVLGTDGAKALGREVLKRFLNVVGDQHRTIGIDEAHNFITDEVESIMRSRESGASYVLADQMTGLYPDGVREQILGSVNHLVCYFVDPETAATISMFHPQLSSSALSALEKYHFLAKVNAQTSIPSVISLQGMLPKDLPS